MTLSPNESVWLPEIGLFIILQQGIILACALAALYIILKKV
jgi:hypothetical protein